VLRWLTNSLTVGFMAATAVTLSSALVAFGFAYFRFRGRNILFGILLSTMMLPGAVTMIPVYLIWNKLGMIDTQIPLWAQNLFGSAFYVFLLRQFFLGIPAELVEAGRLDGLGWFGVFRWIYLPLSKPALAALAIFTFLGSWNNLLTPLIYLPSDLQQTTLPVGLSLLQQQYTGRWTIMMAGSLVSIAPIIIVFFFAQRFFIEGIALSGVRK